MKKTKLAKEIIIKSELQILFGQIF